jgi:selenocysteine lyase/cysteine desulfurase
MEAEIMGLTRRELLQGLGAGVAAMGTASPALAAMARNDQAAQDGRDRGSPPLLAQAPLANGSKISLPDRGNFVFDGIYLNAAYTHPMGVRSGQATMKYVQSRMHDASRNWPVQNAHDEAARLYANLINATPAEIAIVPSTLTGENLIVRALGLGKGAGVVTDSLHYNASLVMYGELHIAGMPLAVIAPRGNKIDYDDLEKAITSETRLVAISLVSSDTGFMHDLKTVCEIAHRKGALVYADIIQAVGAIPFDVRESGVDFCCAGMYKFLMADFGAAFLYVRADRLAEMKRVELGWRAIKSLKKHNMPFDAPGPLIGDWVLGADAASTFEVSTPDWSGYATVVESLAYINDIGVDTIARHRKPLLDSLQEDLPKAHFEPLTPSDHQGTSVVFAYRGAGPRFHDALKRNGIAITIYENNIRISPSIYNNMDDIQALKRVLMA